MKDCLIAVVDEQDKLIGYEHRSMVDQKNLRYRVSALWVTNSKGEILLARRAYNKSHDPGKFGPAAAGTVEKGETYKANMIKEAEEELGIKNIQLKKGPKEKINGKHKYFGQWYTCIIDKPASAFKLQKEEVAEVRWFTKKELAKQLKDHPEEFTNGLKSGMKFFNKP